MNFTKKESPQPQLQLPILNGAGQRMVFVDTLKAALAGLVVCHHLAIAFGAPGGWYYCLPAPADGLSSLVLTWFVAVNQAFFMGLFFFLAAYFTHASVRKRGAAAFMRTRLRTLAIPLVLYIFLANPLLVYLGNYCTTRNAPDIISFVKNNTERSFQPGPLWFVLALLLFSALYVLVRRAKTAIPIRQFVIKFNNRTVVIGILLIGIVTFLLRLVAPVGVIFFGLLVGYFPLYLCMFLCGLVAHKYDLHKQLYSPLTHQWFIWAAIAILLLPPLVVLSQVVQGKPDAFAGGPCWQAYVYAAWEPFVCIGISIKLIQWFHHRCNCSHPLTNTLSRCAFGVYLIHPFVVLGATFLAHQLSMARWALMVLFCPPAVALSFLLAHLSRQLEIRSRVYTQ